MDYYLAKLAKSARALVESINLCDEDSGYPIVRCFVSYDCEDFDELDDVFQAIIDIVCRTLAYDADNDLDCIKIQMYLPGSVADDSMYELGDMAILEYNSTKDCIDVLVQRYKSKIQVKYAYSF